MRGRSSSKWSSSITLPSLRDREALVPASQCRAWARIARLLDSGVDALAAVRRQRARDDQHSCTSSARTQSLPRRPLRRAPRRALPLGARRARRRVLHPCCVEGGSPASLVVLSQLQVESLAVHPHGDVPNASPAIQPGAESMVSTIIRGHGAGGESDCCAEARGRVGPAFGIQRTRQSNWFHAY